MPKTRQRSFYAQTQLDNHYAWTKGDGTKETWPEIARRVVTNVMGAVNASRELQEEIIEVIEAGKFYPGGRYLANAGRDFHQCNNCGLLRVDDTREEWGETARKAIMMLTTGAGIGVVYSPLREEGAYLKRTGGKASGPIPFMKGVNELGRIAISGGHRRAAIWAGLHWNHPDIWKFIELKNWSQDVKDAKAKDWNFPAPMDHTNITNILNDNWLTGFQSKQIWATQVFKKTLRQACTTGDPGFSFDFGINNDENLRNACTELCSCDPDDICNLGSINIANIESLSEMEYVTELSTAFLLAGTVYSDLPYAEVGPIREKNRRLGLGLMGIHEFFIQRGERYGETKSITPYLEIYADTNDWAREQWAGTWDLSVPVKGRAVAPNGTIGIVAETSQGGEPLIFVASQRNYLNNGTWESQAIVDPVAQRLIDDGVDPDSIETSFTLAKDPERRIAFQAHLQKYVDHGISSTVNLPKWGSEDNNPDTLDKLEKIVMKYCTELRGLTFYPDGARSGQPFNPIPYSEAVKHLGEVRMESGDACSIKGGSCGA